MTAGLPPNLFRRGPPVQAAGALTPPVWLLAYVLDDRTGTPATGNTFTPVLTTLAQDGNSISKTAVATVNAAGATYSADGGVVCTNASAYFLDVVPTGAELTELQQRLDMAAMVENETLLVWATLTTPAGWAAAHTTTNTLFSFGSLASGSASGGMDFGIGSTERPQIIAWAKGATAQFGTVMAPDAGFAIDSALNAIVWEVVCTAANTFKVRVHLCAGTGVVTSSAFSTTYNLADAANGGTAAPGCGTTGIRMLRRNGTTTNQTQRDERVRQIGFTRLPATYEGVAAQACRELYARPASIPRVLRDLRGDVTVNTGPDGNADRTFGAISEADMFVYMDGGTAIASHPLFTIETEAGPNKSSGSSAPLSSNPYYVNDTDFEGTNRASAPSQRKFGRHKTGPWAGWIIASGNKLDGGNRGRAEVKWTGTSVEIQNGVEMWVAGRYYFDFMTAEGQAGQLVVNQLFPGPVPADNASHGLFPPFTFTLDTTNERLKIELRTAATTPTLPADMITHEEFPAAYSTREGFRTLLQRNVDIVMLHRMHWDAAQGPRLRIWIDGTLILDYARPYGYRGPKGGTDAKTTNCYVQAGIYPPSPFLTPNTKRDVYIKRLFACKNAGNYTEAQIRAALTA